MNGPVDNQQLDHYQHYLNTFGSTAITRCDHKLSPINGSMGNRNENNKRGNSQGNRANAQTGKKDAHPKSSTTQTHGQARSKNQHNAKHNAKHNAGRAYDSKNISPKPLSAYDIYRTHALTHGTFRGITSIAARHTALEYGKIGLDAGYIPREVGKNLSLLLITHMHTDHSSDILNCIDTNKRLTIFVPAYCARDLFVKIRSDISMQKGRPYLDDEIVKMVRIIGCKRNNENDKKRFGEMTAIVSSDLLSDEALNRSENPGIVIAELVMVGDIVKVQLGGREEVAIESFACYHTVDTCGYLIYELNKRLSPIITIAKDMFIDVNFTEDQQVRVKRGVKSMKGAKTEIHDPSNLKDPSNLNDLLDQCKLSHSNVKSDNSKEQISDNIDNVWTQEPKFADAIAFSHRHAVPINITMVKVAITPKFTLNVRRISFPDGLSIIAKNDNKCMLTTEDIVFLKKYKINIEYDHLTPKTMFFGDTCSYVFNSASIGCLRVMELIKMVDTVIIEASYLESIQEMGDEKYRKRRDNRHMFLFELIPIFKQFPDTQFLLIHFSACYDHGTIIQHTDSVKNRYPNVSAFI